MTRTRGEGRAAAEKAQTVLQTPEARAAHRKKLLDEADEWAAKSGPVVVKSTRVTIYVDGACTLQDRDEEGRHTGPGGWAWVQINPDGTVYRSKSGSEPSTTNQRMELQAALEALIDHRGVKELEIVSDSAYVVNCFKDGWHFGWVARGWKNSAGKPVQNRDLWEALFEELDFHASLTWTHVRGHVGVPGNEAADREATAAKHALMGRDE